MKRLLTVPEVAEICGIAPETVRRMTDRGAMPKPVKIGRAVRYRLTDITSWIEDSCPDPSNNSQTSFDFALAQIAFGLLDGEGDSVVRLEWVVAAKRKSLVDGSAIRKSDRKDARRGRRLSKPSAVQSRSPFAVWIAQGRKLFISVYRTVAGGVLLYVARCCFKFAMSLIEEIASMDQLKNE